MSLHSNHNAMAIKRRDETVKTAAGKKKYSVPFKRKVVQEYLVGLKTPAAIFEGYGVRAGLLHQWHGWHHEHFVQKGNDASKMKARKDKGHPDGGGAEQELARARLEEEKLKVLALEHLVKLAREHHGIDLKKTLAGGHRPHATESPTKELSVACGLLGLTRDAWCKSHRRSERQSMEQAIVVQEAVNCPAAEARSCCT